MNLKTASPLELTELLRQAHVAGMAAGRAASPPTMIVQRHADQFDDSSPVTERYVVPEGPCGFAWVTVKPANSRIGKAMGKLFDGKFGGAARRDSYAGGMMLWVWEFNQSMVRKEAYAYAFAKVLRDAGVEKVYPGSRMD